MSVSDRKRREKELAVAIANSPDIALKKHFMEWLELRLESRLEELVSSGGDLIRGKTQELRDVRKILDKRIDNTTDAP